MTNSSMDISGTLGIQMPGLGDQDTQFKVGDFDLDAHSTGVAWACLVLVTLMFGLWAIERMAGLIWNCGTWAKELPPIFAPKGCNTKGDKQMASKENIGNFATFVWKIFYVGAMFMWAWSSAKTILGHQTAMHIFGGLALGLGLAMRDFFSNALVYFVLKVNAPFSKHDILAVRPRYGELYVGTVENMDFLHTKLHTLSKTGGKMVGSYQLIQNKLIMGNTLAVFAATQRQQSLADAWGRYEAWRKEQFSLAHPVAGVTPAPVETNLPLGRPAGDEPALRHRGVAHLINVGAFVPSGDIGLKF